MSQDMVEAWIAEELPKLDLEAAWHRVGIERTVYARRAEDTLRLGHGNEAKDWAKKAAECERAALVLESLIEFKTEVRDYIGHLKAEKRKAEAEAQAEADRKEKLRKHFAEKRKLEKSKQGVG